MIFEKQYSELNLKQKFIHWILERRFFPSLEGTPINSMKLLFNYYVNDIGKEIELYTSCIEALGNIPILLLSGTDDKTTPIERARSLKRRLKNVKHVEFEGFEHISPNLKKKQAQAIMKEYTAFLKVL
jgi:pimeloyl-ACP methyl ester carboxylesterase